MEGQINQALTLLNYQNEDLFIIQKYKIQ